MAKTLQYWGTGNFQEHPYTGRIVTWTEKEKQTVDDAIATKLLASGAGFVLDNDETGEVVTSRSDPVTGGIVVSAGAASMPLKQSRPLRCGTKGPIASGSVFADMTTATFGGVGGGNGSVGATASQFGQIPIDLVVAPGSAANTAVATVSGSWSFVDDGGPFLVVAEIVSGFTTNDTLKFALSSDAFATKSETATYTHNAARAGENLIFFMMYPDANTFIGAGGESFSSTFNTLQITATSAGGTVGGTMRIHGVWKWHRMRPTVTIQFDDGWASQYTSAFQYMASRGLVGDVGVIKIRVGTAGYVTEAQLKEMYVAGWGMVVHGDKPHNDASFTTQQQIIDDIVLNRDYILDKFGDRGAHHYIYPGGIVNAALDSKMALAAAGMRSGRLVVSQINGRTASGVDAPLSMYGRDLSGSFSAASDLTLLDRAIAAGGSVIFYGHRLVRASPAASEMLYSEFQTLIDGISDRVRDGKVDVVTQSQLIDGF